MSIMYGKRRVVLRTGRNQIVAVCGSEEPSANYPGTGKHGGDYSPVGYWYQQNGLFYVDLKSEEQEYRPITRDEVAHKHLGAFKTKRELRDFVMRIDQLRWQVYKLRRDGKSATASQPAAILDNLLAPHEQEDRGCPGSFQSCSLEPLE